MNLNTLPNEYTQEYATTLTALTPEEFESIRDTQLVADVMYVLQVNSERYEDFSVVYGHYTRDFHVRLWWRAARIQRLETI